MISVSSCGRSFVSALGIRVPDSRRRQIASSRTDTSRTEWQEEDIAVAILDIGGVNDGVEQQTQRIYKKVALLAFDLLARIKAMRIDTGPPFSALLTLWLSMMAAVGLASAFASLTALHIKRVMNAIERAVVAPQVEIVVHRAAWG